MLKRKNKKALPEQLEDSLYPDDYWLDKEDGQEVSEPLPDGENPVSGKLRKEPMVTGYEALERQRGVRRPKRKITRREKKALKQAQKYEAKLRKEQERADKKSEKREAKLAEKAEKEAMRQAKKDAKKRKSKPASTSGQKAAGNRKPVKTGTNKTAVKADTAKEKQISAQQSIPYHEMAKDGICRVQDKFYSKTIRFYDINYQLAQNEDKNAIFENWCDFLNYFDSTIHFQLSFINQHSNMAEFEKVILIKPQDDEFDELRMEFAQMLKNQLYSSTDEDIYAAENAYKALEEALNTQINQIESRHPDYDEYRYQIDEIGHNPYQLISYLTVKYGGFTYAEVADEIKEIFQQQYGINTQSTRETVTETKTVRVGESLGQVVTSGYCNCSICCGQWSGGPTASGAMPTANHTIAVDATNPFVPIGTHVVMNGVEYVVEDTGAFARYGVQFDVYYDNHAAASAHGHQTWEAYIADSNGSQEVEVTTTKEVNRLDVTMTNHNLDTVLRSRMTEEEQERYDAYNRYYGNRDYLFDLNSIPTGSSGFGYTIPGEALSDPQFAKMIREAEKYLGVPYVWGGYSPSGFDCSGFVSWVINNCGNGWNIGRCTADELRSHCSQVSPSEAKPGDLIFFQGTYNTSGASHVGIYVGNNMMIHCGKPVQYTSIASSYWQEHFMAFGRLH